VEDGPAVGAIVLLFDKQTPLEHHGSGASVDTITPSIDDDAEHAGKVRAESLQEQTASAAQFLTASNGPVSATLALLDRTAPGLSQYLHRAWRKIYTTRRRRTVGIVTGLVTAVMLLPLHYEVDCDAELQPVSRRFVAAPFEGTLRECRVRPGEYVQKDTLLAVMDEREIEYELAGLVADISRARTEQNTHRSGHEYSDAKIAAHEVERLRQRSELLEYRSENLELRSPIDGIVVSGDLKDSEGVPLKTGDSLFEIAPLDKMTIEIAIPEEDMRQVSVGMPVQLTLDAMPSEQLHSRIIRIHPAAELRDHENVFIAEAEILNEDETYRPGMRGSATIQSHRHPLGWNLFHKPVARLTGWLGW